MESSKQYKEKKRLVMSIFERELSADLNEKSAVILKSWNQHERKMAHQPQMNICEPCYCISVICG